MLLYLIIALMALIGGTVQGVAGFGAGPVDMMVLPFFFPVNEAVGINAALCVGLNILMLSHYHSYVNFKKVLTAALLYVTVSASMIFCSKYIDQDFMKHVLGVFLIVLSLYYLFFSKKEEKELTRARSVIYLLVSGACDGLFGIGGPLMSIYFLKKTSSKEEYLGTIQTLFLISLGYGTIVRIFTGILTAAHAPYIGIGLVFILIGGWISTKIVDRIDADKMKKIIYILIGITGIINVFR